MKSSRSFALCRSLKLRGHAASMREAGTPSERALWQLLRAGQLGVHFRRQVSLLGCYIVDFYCPAAKLVVEVDGPYHADPTRLRADARRVEGWAHADVVLAAESGECRGTESPGSRPPRRRPPSMETPGSAKSSTRSIRRVRVRGRAFHESIVSRMFLCTKAGTNRP